MEERASPWAELGGDYFVRSLQDFVRSSDRRVAELSFEKAQLESRVAQLETLVANKDRIIKEYLRRVALLEFSLRKTGAGRTVKSMPVELPEPVAVPPPTRPSAKELIRKYLEELGDLSMPSGDDGLDELAVRESDEDSTDNSGFQHEAVLGSSLGRCGAVLLGTLRGSPCIITGGEEGVVKLWTDENLLSEPDLKNLSVSQKAVTPHLALRHHTAPISAVACDAASNSLASGDDSGEIAIWTVNESLGKLELYASSQDIEKVLSVRSLGGVHAGRVNALAMNGQAVLSAGADGRIVFSSNEQVVSGEFVSIPTAVIWGERASAGFIDGSVAVVDPVSGKAIFTDHYGSRIIAIDSFENVLAIAHDDGALSLVDLVSGSVIERVMTGGESLSALTCSAPRLATGDTDGSVCIWDVRKLGSGPLQSLPCHKPRSGEGVTDLSFATDGTRLASAGADGKVNIFHRTV